MKAIDERTKASISNDLAIILRTLPHADARHDSSTREGAHGCFPRTRETVLQQIQNWMDDKNHSRAFMYWLSGIGGIGKSTIAQTVAEKEVERGRLGASFFFSRDVADHSHARLFFPSLAYQLAIYRPDFRGPILAAASDNPGAPSSSLSVQLQKLIIEPLRGLDASTEVVTVVVDALDECSPGEDAETILQLLASELPRLPFRVKILITSRPEHHLRIGFGSDGVRCNAEGFILHNMDESTVQQDIALYLDHELKMAAKKFSTGENWPSTEQFSALVQRAGAFFIFAATAMLYIAEEKWANPRQRLTSLLNGTVSGASPYAAVDLLYHQVLSDALPEAEHSRRFGSIVGPVVLLSNPLSIGGLSRLLQVDKESIVATLSSLHSLLIVPTGRARRSEPIRIMHPSFPEYLMDPNRCKNPDFLVHPPTQHARIASCCLEAILTSVRRDMCGVGDSLVLNEDVVDLTARLDTYIPEEVRYACRHFGSHLQASEGRESELLPKVRIFFKERVLEWLEVLSLLGRLRDASPNLRAVRNWLSVGSFLFGDP